jgi:hypothetical protein
VLWCGERHRNSQPAAQIAVLARKSLRCRWRRRFRGQSRCARRRRTSRRPRQT